MDYHVHLVGHGDSGSGCYLHDSVSDPSLLPFISISLSLSLVSSFAVFLCNFHDSMSGVVA